MRAITRAMVSATAGMLILVSPSAVWAQHKHSAGAQEKAGMTPEMTKLMQSPHHVLMMAHVHSVSEFTRTLRDQAAKPAALDLQFARAAVAEIRHNLVAMEAIHQKHMPTMNAEMQSKMQTMMEKMDQDRATLKDQVSALEADVRADAPDSRSVVAHSNAILKHLDMMAMMNHGKKMGTKMDMKKRMDKK